MVEVENFRNLYYLYNGPKTIKSLTIIELIVWLYCFDLAVFLNQIA